MASYYERDQVTHLDGTKVFQNSDDRRNEIDVASILSKKWECRLARFGDLSPIDWYAERHGRVVGVLELKSRTHPSNKFDTVFLNVRKWLSLNLASIGLGCPALFVVKFTNDLRWIKVSDIDASRQRIAGCSRLVKSASDIEPVIEVEISKMLELGA
jgi:hypothetical protein